MHQASSCQACQVSTQPRQSTTPTDAHTRAAAVMLFLIFSQDYLISGIYVMLMQKSNLKFQRSGAISYDLHTVTLLHTVLYGSHAISYFALRAKLQGSKDMRQRHEAIASMIALNRRTSVGNAGNIHWEMIYMNVQYHTSRSNCFEPKFRSRASNFQSLRT
jgi:hypothetical protein